MELISRDEVMRLAESGRLLSGSFGERAKDIIASLPTIEERKEGEWITEYNGNGWNDFWDYTCSVCGKKYERADMLCKANFCPNCGARMKGE